MIAVVLAAYNEAAHLEELLPRVPATVNGMRVQMIVVCDGSVDGTCAVAERMGAIVVPLAGNHGKWFAMRSGIERSKKLGAKVLATMDADGQHDPASLPRLVSPIQSGRADVTIGSRYLANPGRGCAPRNRYAVRVISIALLDRLVGRCLTDPYSGFRAFSSAALDRMRLVGDRYQGELETIFEAHRLGLRVVELPVVKVYGDDTSKMGAFHGKLWGRVSVISQYGSVFVRHGPAAVRVADLPEIDSAAA